MDALIFDFDGTIVDTEPLHEAALRAALAPLGIPVEEGVTIGLSDEEAIRRACDQAGVPRLSESDALATFERKVAGFADSLDRDSVVVYPGAVELFREAAEVMPVGICTAAMRTEVIPIIEWLGIGASLGTLVTSDDVSRKKPAPDGYLLACDRLGVEPRRALALEDSPRGVQAAVDAGLCTLAIGHTTPEGALDHAHRYAATVCGLTVAQLREFHASHSHQD